MSENENLDDAYISDIAILTMVPDEKLDVDVEYNPDLYRKDEESLVNHISSQFEDYLRTCGFMKFLPSIGIQFCDAYYIPSKDTNTGSGLFGLGLKISNSKSLISFIESKKQYVDYYMLHFRSPFREENGEKEEESLTDVIDTISKGTIPQCVAYVLKKDFEISGKEVIEFIRQNTDFEEFLVEDPDVKQDVKYLTTLDSVENLKRNGLKYEGFLEGVDGTKYYFFSRSGKETFFYKMTFGTEGRNAVEIEFVEE